MNRIARQAWLWAVVAALLAVPAVVQAQFIYTTNSDNTITIAKYTGSGGAVSIPGKINGLTVVGVGNRAFRSCTNLTSVTIPASVTNIGDAAFSHCASLTSVTIPNGVASIGRVAFVRCKNLISVTIPDSVFSVGDDAFSGCTSLTSIMVGNGVTSIRKGMFSGCTNLTNVVIPKSVSNIGELAFAGCTSLTNVVLVNSVTSIVAFAFLGCDGLTSVTIPNSVTNIGEMAFQNCTRLTAFTMDGMNSAYSTRDGVLFDTSQTLLVQYPEGKAGKYTIPDSVAQIGDAAFGGCRSLTEVTIPDSVTNIEDDAFTDCSSLSFVTVSKNATCLGDGVFADCTRLTKVTFRGNAPSLGTDVFKGDDKATIYHLANATGWGKTFGGRPTAIWNPQTNAPPAAAVSTNSLPQIRVTAKFAGHVENCGTGGSVHLVNDPGSSVEAMTNGLPQTVIIHRPSD